MSRALNLDVPMEAVIDMCAKKSAKISAIEPLLSGGTRVVMLTADDAAVISRVYAAKLLKGLVQRMPLRPRR